MTTKSGTPTNRNKHGIQLDRVAATLVIYVIYHQCTVHDNSRHVQVTHASFDSLGKLEVGDVLIAKVFAQQTATDASRHQETCNQPIPPIHAALSFAGDTYSLATTAACSSAPAYTRPSDVASPEANDQSSELPMGRGGDASNGL
jgi:hypothetical protein